MPQPPITPEESEKTLEVFTRHNGNVSSAARELGIARQSLQDRMRKIGNKKPMAGGRVKPVKNEKRKVTEKVHRFILTSAQNNTYVHEACLTNLQAFAKHYKAEILVGTFSYNQNSYGKLAVKRGTKKPYQSELWYDERIMSYILAGDNKNIEIGPHLMWCGRANVLPTAIRPLEGFEGYSGRHTGIFPHAKQDFESVVSGKNEATKFNYTTGTVTQQNYIQKKAGLKAEGDHVYGGLLVEVCKDGRWYVRPLVQGDDGTMYDLTLCAVDGKITDKHRVAGINWGDVHSSTLETHIYNLAFAKGGMLDELQPFWQFFHDTLDFKGRNPHVMLKNLPRERFMNYVNGFDSVEMENRQAAMFLHNTTRPWCQSVVVSSNHDEFFARWLDFADYRRDPINACYFLHSSAYMYDYIAQNKKMPNMFQYACEKYWKRPNPQVKFLALDESFIICPKHRGGIECGMHGDDGANGAAGSEAAFARMGRRVNVGHRHTASLRQWGVGYAGLLGNLDQGYNVGPGSWSQTQIVTYANSVRAAITFWKGAYKA